jgi:hypothetical protein
MLRYQIETGATPILGISSFRNVLRIEATISESRPTKTIRVFAEVTLSRVLFVCPDEERTRALSL